MVSNVTLPPYPSFLVHFKHTVVAHPTKISHFSITVTPPQGTRLATPPNSERAPGQKCRRNYDDSMHPCRVIAV